MFVITPSDVKLMLNHVITHYKQNHPFPLVILGEELTGCGLTVEGLTNFNISLPNNVDAEIAYVKLFHFLFRMATVRLMGLPMDDTNYKAVLSVLESLYTITGFASRFRTDLLTDMSTGRYILNIIPIMPRPGTGHC